VCQKDLRAVVVFVKMFVSSVSFHVVLKAYEMHTKTYVRTWSKNVEPNLFKQGIDKWTRIYFYAPQLYRQVLLRRVLAMAILSVCLSVGLSVCLSVHHNPVPNQAQVR